MWGKIDLNCGQKNRQISKSSQATPNQHTSKQWCNDKCHIVQLFSLLEAYLSQWVWPHDRSIWIKCGNISKLLTEDCLSCKSARRRASKRDIHIYVTKYRPHWLLKYFSLFFSFFSVLRPSYYRMLHGMHAYVPITKLFLEFDHAIKN